MTSGKYLVLGLGAVCLAIGLAGFSAVRPAGAAAQAAVQAGPGPFTAAQVQDGRAAYADSCAGCHGATLSGGPNATALTGPGFAGAWGARSTADFYHYVSTAMPYGSAGNLSATAYANIVAFIYAANGARPGARPYAPDTDVTIGTIADGKTVTDVVSPPGGGDMVLIGGVMTPRITAMQGLPFGQTVNGTVKAYADVTDAMLVHPADGEWPMFRRTYQGWSYSPLAAITPHNVRGLQLKWSWAMNEGGANQPTPIVHSGVMFLTNTSNTVQALDARTGELIWENRIGPAATVPYGGTRSIALYGDKVYIASTDAKLYALDARTGHIAWQAEIGAAPKSETGGVMAIKGKILVGLMGCDTFSASHCYISAFDAQTGRRDWKFFTTALSGTPGGDTWNNLPDDVRGGVDTWIAGTYDPELNTTYWGTAQAKPWMRASRQTGAGAALYSVSTLALDPDTGALKWYFQHIPGESLDLDEVFERLLIDHGRQKTVMTIGKSGILWKLDRVTGKYIAAMPTIFQNVYSHIDWATGAVTYRQDLIDQKTNQWYGSCPGPEGGHNWQATSYNPPTDLLIIPLSQSCVLMNGRDVEMKPGGGGTAASQKFYFMPGTHRQLGRLTAVNTTTMKTVWSWQQQSPFLTAALSTGGGLAFIGDFDRRFRALDVKTGKTLWQARLGNTVQGFPISFSLDGKQYVAVTTGLGGGSPQQKPALLLDNVHRPPTGQQLYVFGLPD